LGFLFLHIIARWAFIFIIEGTKVRDFEEKTNL
jgi:hypothetical protein